MVDLPRVSEDFTADASGYIAALNLMIEKTQTMINKVGELKTLIDTLDGKDIQINIAGDASAQLDEIATKIEGLENRTIVINAVYKQTGSSDVAAATQQVQRVFVGNENLPPIIQPVIDKVVGSSGGGAGNIANEFQKVITTDTGTAAATSAESALAAAIQNVTNRMNVGNLSAERAAAVLSKLAYSQQVVASAAQNDADSMTRLQQEIIDSETQMSKLWAALDRDKQSMDDLNSSVLRTAAVMNALGAAELKLEGDSAGAAALLEETRGIVKLLGDNTEKSTHSILDMALAAKATAASVGAAAIPLGLVAFGITGIGTAIHLVVMGIFEFLAVFIPALYAAAAAAYTMMQGVQLISHEISGLYTVTEALGPMFNTTAGDMLGLGHTMQTAQNLANPGVYTLLGEAIQGIKAATGPATNGLSAFGQMGLDVTHILDQFGAKLVVDLQDNMGLIRSVLSNAVQDLVMFGQIFGNLGHALLNLAAAMPGLAEVILRIIDGFTALIKWVSQLPPALLTAVMVIEEMYRWGGLLAGMFGVLGRAIALVGTLGLPIFARIGSSVAAMFAALIEGFSGAIKNFVAMGEKIGVFGERVDKAASGLVGGLSKATAFLTGPWGFAFGLGVLAVGGLIFAITHLKGATQEWIDTSARAVQNASNLQVMNVIAQQFAQAGKQIADNQAYISRTQQTLTKDASGANGALQQQASTMNSVGKAALETGDQTARAAVSQMAMKNAIDASNGTIQQLTGYQKQLIGQNMNVVTGAALISKTYGVDFTTALGMADIAGVKLANGITGQSKAAQQARIQIEGLYLGYAKMDQTGTTLANSMNAVNIQAGIQASKVSQVNQAWDQFIGMSTSLTGSFTQFNLDLSQMGNQAATVGGKIVAFKGDTGQSVQQIANDLRTFQGSSAQTWQAFNQSVSQANTFMDALRVAATTGTVSQKQFGGAMAYVVGQLMPYASQNRAALAEVMALAQESGGPAYDATKSLAQNYQILNNWVGKNADSSKQFGRDLNNLTVGISNVTTVARNFAGTLQSDVLNAVASAGADTAKITQLTQAYTTALQNNAENSPKVKSAQDALTNALKSYGLSAQDISQVEDILTNTYGKNQTATGNNMTAQQKLAAMVTNTVQPAFVNWAHNGLDLGTNQANLLWNQLTTKLGPELNNSLANSVLSSKRNFEAWAGPGGGSGLGLSRSEADKLYQEITGKLIPSLHNIPKNVHTNITASASGSGGISTHIQGLPGGASQNIQAQLLFGGAASGGVIPGYEPGVDSVPMLLSKGEGVLVPQAVRALGGERGINAINRKAQGMAAGGIVGGFTNPIRPEQFETNDSDNFNVDVERAYMQRLISLFNGKVAAVKAQVAAALAASSSGAALGGNVISWVQAAMKDTGAPASWLGPLLTLVSRESGGNPNAVNPIAVFGEHASGLFQTLPSTYAQFATVGGGVFNPVADAVAGIRYIMARYGSPFNIPGLLSGHYVGYDSGGYLMPGLTLAYNGTGKPETVIPGDGIPIQLNHQTVLNGKVIAEETAQYFYQKASRNNGNANTGKYWTPGNR